MVNNLLENKVDIMPKWKTKDPAMELLASEILNHWNSKRIIVHRKYSRKTPLILKRIVEEYSKEEIFQSIDNYSAVYHDEEYYFNYKWDLETFLQKSNTLPAFMNDGSKWLSYLGVMVINPKKKNDLPLTIAEHKKEIVIASEDFHFIEESYSAIIDAFNRMPYCEYLQTSHWIHFRNEILEASGYRCKMCNTPDKTLHVHHNNYSNRGRETFNDAIVICDLCHAKFHDKL